LLVTAAAAAAAAHAAAAHAAAASRNSCIASGSWVMVGVAAEV
jgi:outer membrane protein W